MDWEERYKKLLIKYETLHEDHVRMKQLFLNPKDKLIPGLGLTVSEEIIAEMLLNKEYVTFEQLMFALQTPEGDNTKNTIKVLKHNCQKKLNPLKVKIHNIFAKGYYITPEDKKKIRRKD